MLSTPAPIPERATVYYHADCLDGFGAAYAAWRRFGDAARYRPMHHGDAWLAENVAGRDVYVLDFSFPPEVLTGIARLARSVRQLDHHASAREPWRDRLAAGPDGLELFEDGALGLTVAFDLDRSGARIAWEHFHPGAPVPLAIAHIEDQDLWRFAIPGTRAFCRALRLRAFAFDAWDAIVRSADDPEREPYRRLCAEGEAIERFVAIEVERLAASALVMPVRLAATPGAPPVAGPAINASALFASDLGSLLAARSGSFALIWQLGADGLVKVSLRAAGQVDVARIAQRYGGGGHPNAAGFRLPLRRFIDEILAAGSAPEPG